MLKTIVIWVLLFAATYSAHELWRIFTKQERATVKVVFLKAMVVATIATMALTLFVLLF